MGKAATKQIWKSSGTGAHAALLPVFPQSPPLIPYGGFSPVPVGRRLSQRSSLPLAGLLKVVPLSPGLTLSRGLVALAGNPLTVSPVRCVCRPTGPSLSAVYHARTCKRYYGLMRQSGGLRPVYGLYRPVFALAGRPPHLPFFALTHALRPCRYLYPADCPSSFDGSSPGHASLHLLLSGSAVSVCPLTGFREVRLTRQQYSLHVAACTLASLDFHGKELA